MIVYIYNIGVDLYNGFNGLRHRINWTYFTVFDGLAHPLYSSYVLKTVREFFLFLFLFIPIRVNLGGYHCKTKINCYICSVSSCILFPTLIKFARINYLFEFILAQIYIYISSLNGG